MKFIKAIFFISLCSTLNAKNLDSINAIHHLDEWHNVCGVIHSIKNTKYGTLVNIGGAYPHQHITFSLKDKTLQLIEGRLGSINKYVGRTACALGYISNYKSNPFLQVNNQTTFRILR